MVHNVGNTDRIIRFIAGLVIMVIGLMNHSWWGLLGLIPIATGLFRSCPAYSMLGKNTCSTEESVSS
ncbi:MAG TPA: DUF2892 domain-containing protein [Gammaproteobacteria bacterium]|jgi:hypothetical protein|nr:DUF2892 domain-containing protein [Gammaproteobacteria bacterium]